MESGLSKLSPAKKAAFGAVIVMGFGVLAWQVVAALRTGGPPPDPEVAAQADRLAEAYAEEEEPPLEGDEVPEPPVAPTRAPVEADGA